MYIGDELNTGWEHVAKAHMSYLENEIVLNYKIRYRMNVRVTHYLDVIKIFLIDDRFDTFQEDLLEGAILEFEQIGNVVVNQGRFEITVRLDFLKIFLKQNKVIKAYYRVFSNDDEKICGVNLYKIRSIVLNPQSIYIDANESNDILKELILNSKEGEVIYLFSLARSSNTFMELVCIILFLNIKGVELIIGDTYFKAFLNINLLIQKLSNLESIYEKDKKSLKIKNGQGKISNEKNKKIGRPKVEFCNLPEYILENYKLLENGKINMSQFASISGISRPTAYKYKEMIEGE